MNDAMFRYRQNVYIGGRQWCTWGVVLLVVGIGLLARVTYLLVSGFDLNAPIGEFECDSLLFYDGDRAYAASQPVPCIEARAWPKLLALSVGSMPFLAAGSALWAVGMSRIHTYKYFTECDRLQDAYKN
ncbi:hypothetical protein ACRAR1_27245 [Streptomyces sanyensis]|uniref:hypothetical protein n=1 Tax=Streptomyces sanyensis TaxID=568869 RepID=UPI003D771341